MSTFDGLTDVQLSRLWRRLYARMSDRFAGGRQYGVDWPTLWFCYPGMAVLLSGIRAELVRRMG